MSNRKELPQKTRKIDISLGGSLAARSWLGAAVRRIIARAKPEKVILFGSHAYGRPHRDSDFDLLIIFRDRPPRDKAYDMVSDAIGEHLWPVDTLIRSREEVAHRLKIGDSFFQKILQRGTILYES